MGKRKKKEKERERRNKDEKMFQNVEPMALDFDDGLLRNKNVKVRSRLNKKMRKKLRKFELKTVNSDKQFEGTVGYPWHKVLVTVSSDVDRQFLLSSIGNYVDTPFLPLGYHKVESNICFFFEKNDDVASAIESLDKRIQTLDGEAMKISVIPVSVPDHLLNANQLEILKEVVIKRFDTSTGMLDLSRLYLDSQLMENNIFVPISHSVVMKQIIKIIQDGCLAVTALNLSGNKIDANIVHYLRCLPSSCSLFALNLEDNNLHSLNFLKCINVFPIKELKLKSNKGLEERRKNQEQFFKLIVKELPNLILLDDVEVESVLPKNVSSSNRNLTASTTIAAANLFSVTEESLNIFLEQFYSLIDSTSREGLLQAYLPSAKIELKSANPAIPNGLFDGQLEIANFLATFPETKHLHSSFNLQILELNSLGGSVLVKGQCHIGSIPEPLLFERSMRIIPYNSGLCCSLDSLQIR